jgi:hypothetical protein
MLTHMRHHAAIKIPLMTTMMLFLPGVSFSQDCYDYKHTKDPVVEKVVIDAALNSDFFSSHKTSYPWYILRTEDGGFESTLNQPITREDRIPIEHTSNCVSTHQGEHVMDYCEAILKPGVLALEIHGGEPGYVSSLLVTIEGQYYKFFFKAAYPMYDPHCLKWKIVSKKLKIKSAQFGRGKRVYAWISVVLDETTTGKVFNKSKRYTIEGYLKPVVKQQ